MIAIFLDAELISDHASGRFYSVSLAEDTRPVQVSVFLRCVSQTVCPTADATTDSLASLPSARINDNRNDDHSETGQAPNPPIQINVIHLKWTKTLLTSASTLVSGEKTQHQIRLYN